MHIQNEVTKEKNELEKYIKFLSSKVAQVVVQSRYGHKFRREVKEGYNDWVSGFFFNSSFTKIENIVQKYKNENIDGLLPDSAQPCCDVFCLHIDTNLVMINECCFNFFILLLLYRGTTFTSIHAVFVYFCVQPFLYFLYGLDSLFL